MSASDDIAMKYAVRDLPHLHRAISLCTYRRQCIQAGGSLGVWPRMLAREFEDVYTFEPAADVFAKLTHNTAGYSNVHRFQAALGFDRSQVGLSCTRRDDKKLPDHPGLIHVSGSGSVPVMRIDDLAMSACDLIYLDIEGYELPALAGAYGTISRQRPVIAFEQNQNAELAGWPADRANYHMVQIGYSFFERNGSDNLYLPNERLDECTAKFK